MARAKQTDRAEARRRYRQTAAEADVVEDGAEFDYGERRPATGPKATQSRTPDRQPTGRVGFLDSFRLAYHPAHVREDLRALPELIRSRALLASLLLVVAGAVVSYLFWGYTGGQTVFQLVLLPGSALAPQLVAGFFAPRASYLLGLIVAFAQGAATLLLLGLLASRSEGTPLTADLLPNLLLQSFFYGPITGMLFAAGAAWYRRFLALSSPRRAPAARSGSKRSGR